MDFNIKKLITLALIIGATTLTQAQSNLVFNRVLNFTVTSSNQATVPEGKVWKLEHQSSSSLRINKADVAYGQTINNVALYSNTKPTWYSEGTVLYASSSTVSLSILEFNVEPISSSSGGSSSRLSSEGLVFSQVINYSGTYNFPTTYNGHIYETFEIPEGKVWKITSVTVAKINGVTSIYDTAVRPSREVGVQLGGIVIHLVSGGGAAYPEVNPINDTWINSGSKELFVTSYGANIKVSFTAIEYTIPE